VLHLSDECVLTLLDEEESEEDYILTLLEVEDNAEAKDKGEEKRSRDRKRD